VTNRLRVERLEARDLPAVPFQSLPIFPFQNLTALDHARAIAALGDYVGRRDDVLLKIGDSNSSAFPTSHFLAPLGSAGYDPVASGLAATHPELLDTWWEYRTAPNSLAREGPSAFPGERAPQVLASLAREIRRVNPGIALVMIGTNDAMVTRDGPAFRAHLGRIVEVLLEARVVPVLSTIPDSHFRGSAYQPLLMAFNQIIAGVAERYAVPLWNAWATWHRLPNHGLRPDGVHLNFSPNGAGSFWAADLLFAQNARNLQALRILDWFRESVCEAALLAPPARDWQPMASGRALYAVGRDAGSSSRVDVFDAATGTLVNRFLAFHPTSTLGVRVVTGDTNDDGFLDIVCWSDRAGTIRVVSGADGSTLGRHRPFGELVGTGLSVAIGDLDADGALEIVAARGGRTPGVVVIGGRTGAVLTTFEPFAERIRSVSVSVAGVEGMGAVIAVARGGRNPEAAYFTPLGQRVGTLTLDGPIRRPVIVAADLDRDGFDEIVVGRSGARETVDVYDAVARELVASQDIGPVPDRGFGIRLGVLHGPDGDLLLVASAPGMAVGVRGYDDLAGEPILLPLERAQRAFGIFVG
jgi:hypothetical protein